MASDSINERHAAVRRWGEYSPPKTPCQYGSLHWLRNKSVVASRNCSAAAPSGRLLAESRRILAETCSIFFWSRFDSPYFEKKLRQIPPRTNGKSFGREENSCVSPW